MRISSIPGVSKSKSEKLIKNNYEFAEDLAVASAWRVSAIEGVSPQVISNAQEYVGYSPDEVDENEIGYECERCGKEFDRWRKSRFAGHVRDFCGKDEDSGWL
jgi:hypothetical protein